MPNSKTSQLGIQGKLLIAFFIAAVIPFGTLAAVIGLESLTSTAGLVAIVVLAMALMIAWGICIGFLRQAEALDKTLREINQGDYEARVEVVTNDEMGIAAESLNVMCDNTLNLVHSHDEKGDVQSSIENLVLQVESIAAGDLTMTAEVKSDVTGAIASSVNNMTEQLRSIVQRVKTATEQVNQSASSIRQSSTEMSNDSDQKAREINEASQKLIEMTEAFQKVAARTEESVNVAVEARQTASDGLKAVNDTVEGMQRIRAQVQNTSKRIKRLGESSQEIGEIVQLISDIADRTSILALNASIQAAMAGDAGQGFAVVAEEVERLAERSASATKQVARLIRTIQSETNEVISDMEESTREVVTGSQLATQAGETLFEIDSVSNQLVEIIESVSDSARSQAQNVTVVASTMQQISTGTLESAEKSRQATHSVNQLATMANELRASVSRFNVECSDESLIDKLKSAHPPVAPQPARAPAAIPTPATPAPEGQPGPADHQDLMNQLRKVSRMMDEELHDDDVAPVSPTIDADNQRLSSTISSTMMMPDNGDQ